MRIKNLMPIIIALLFSSFQSSAQGILRINNPIRLMDYNIRFDNPSDGSNVWANRKDKVISMIRFYTPDIICLQEPLINQIDDLNAAFPHFDYYGVGREDGLKGGELNPIFYDKRRFTLIANGTFWLSETPEVVGSKSWFATLPRIVSWVRLKDLSCGKEFFVFNTHFDHISQNARDRSADIIMKKIPEIAGDLPIVLTGDLNDRPFTYPYNQIVNSLNPFFLDDASTVSKNPHHGPTFTFVGFDFVGIPGRIIDYIFVNARIEVLQHAVLSDNWDGIYPSDHLPVFVEFNLK
jgi:endonuclease/exonuclease/phosphatase family metal-dependent hydrolase